MNIFHFFVLSRCDIIELNSPKSCVQETATSIRCKVLVLHTQKKKSDNGTWCCAWQCFTLLLVAFVIIYQAVVKKILESVVDKIQRHLPQLIHETFLICQNLDIHAGRQLCENKLSLWIYIDGYFHSLEKERIDYTSIYQNMVVSILWLQWLISSSVGQLWYICPNCVFAFGTMCYWLILNIF